MTILTVDTSCARGSVALLQPDHLVAQKFWSREGSHGEFLTPAVEAILDQSKLDLKNISRVAVGIGPGSFTGIRVAINFARTLAHSLGIPVYTMNSLELMALQTQAPNMKFNKSSVHCIQYAFRDLLYVAEYEHNLSPTPSLVELRKPYVITISEYQGRLSAPVLALGTGASLIRSDFLIRNEELTDYPDAKYFLYSNVFDQSPAKLTDWIHTIPLYIRASEAEEKLKTFNRN